MSEKVLTVVEVVKRLRGLEKQWPKGGLMLMANGHFINEATERIRKNMKDTKTDGLEQEPKRTRGHVSYCALKADHEGDCYPLSGASEKTLEVKAKQ